VTNRTRPRPLIMLFALLLAVFVWADTATDRTAIERIVGMLTAEPKPLFTADAEVNWIA
jgi:hypothetical protein